MEKTIRAEVFGENVQALFSKKGTPYVKATLVTKDEDGNIDMFLNACFFPEEQNVQKLRNYLCRGREVLVTGNYNEREYEGKDGTMKTAHDILVHSVKLGGIVEYGDGEAKHTDFSFIKEADQKAADAEMAKASKKPAKKGPSTLMEEPDSADALFDNFGTGKPTKKAASKKKVEEDDEFDMDSLDL